MSRLIKCAHCRRLFSTSPRVKNQRYCGRKECQRARKSKWQREKMATDPDYRANQRESQRNWCRRNPDYWRKYRSRKHQYRQRNRTLQRCRDKERKRLAKMDALSQVFNIKPGGYILLPQDPHLAKMDALRVKIIPISMC
jgi:hypothetical protein